MNTIEVAPSQGVGFTHHGRRYGMPDLSLDARRERDPAPELGKIFLEDIITRSAILALPGDPPEKAVLEAYSHDIAMIAERRKESDGFLFQALACALDRFNVDQNKRVQEVEALNNLLEPLGIVPQIALTAEKCALAPAELAVWLKQEFHAEMDRIARRIAVTLHYLADQHVVGLLDWKSPSVLKFHYFTWSMAHSSSTSQKVVGDIMTWNTLVTTKIDTAKLTRVRHTHHVVGAGVHKLEDYAQPMPQRIRSLVESAPAFLKKHLIVVDGTEVLSEKLSQFGGESVRVSTESVVRYDPGIALGPIVFAGWGAEDLQPETQAATEKWTWLSLFSWRNAYLVLSVALCTLMCYWLVNKLDKSSQKAYAVYTAVQPQAGAVMTARKGERIQLPLNYALIFKGPTSAHSRSIRFATYEYAGQYPREVFHDIALPSNYRNVGYGDIDLRFSLGLPVVLHVTAFEDGKLSYVAEGIKPLTGK